jgi:hypothetical protein
MEGNKMITMTETGPVAVWYMKPSCFRDFILGSQGCKDMNIPLPDPKDLSKTHALIGRFEGVTSPDDLFAATNAPDADPIEGFDAAVKKADVWHTSLSIGDVVVMDGKTFMCDMLGWLNLEAKS